MILDPREGDRGESTANDLARHRPRQAGSADLFGDVTRLGSKAHNVITGNLETADDDDDDDDDDDGDHQRWPGPSWAPGWCIERAGFDQEAPCTILGPRMALAGDGGGSLPSGR